MDEVGRQGRRDGSEMDRKALSSMISLSGGDIIFPCFIPRCRIYRDPTFAEAPKFWGRPRSRRVTFSPDRAAEEQVSHWRRPVRADSCICMGGLLLAISQSSDFC